MIRGEGMPSYRHHNPGNMFVKFEIEFPTHTPPLNEEQRSLLKSALGIPPGKPRAPRDANGMDVDQDPLELDILAAPLPANVQEDEVDLEEVDHTGQQRANRATMEDDDDDGVPPGHERMQCASQ